MRPDSIRKFDLFYLASVAVGLASTLLNYDRMEQALQEQLAASGMTGGTEGFLLSGLAIGFALSLALWFLTSRMRIGAMRWLLLLFVAYRAVSIPYALSTGLGSFSITGTIAVLLQVIAVWFLFRPDAREWFATKPG